jgi:hypothetical protein
VDRRAGAVAALRREAARGLERAIGLDATLFEPHCEGATDEALRALEEVARAGFGNKEWFRQDPDLASLRDDPRSQALMARD